MKMKRPQGVENKHGEARQQLEKKGARHLRMNASRVCSRAGKKDEGKIEDLCGSGNRSANSPCDFVRSRGTVPALFYFCPCFASPPFATGTSYWSKPQKTGEELFGV